MKSFNLIKVHAHCFAPFSVQVPTEKQSITTASQFDKIMTKRVPINSFTTEEGNPDDKRPRVTQDNHPFHQLQPSTSSSSSGRNHLELNEGLLPSTSSSVDALSSSPSSILTPNGTFYTNGNTIFGGGGVLLLDDNTHSKCSICLWPIGSSRCYHGLHNHPTSHRPTTTTTSH